MKRKKRLVSYLLVCILSVSMGLIASAEKSEISTQPTPSWVSNEVETWKDLDLLRGDSQGNLLLQNEVSRVEFITFINRIMNHQVESDKLINDVPENAWYASEMKKAIAAGIIQGDEKGNMNPTQSLTREEAALILTRIFQLIKPTEEIQSFQDHDTISAWAKDAVYTLKHAGFVVGNSAGKFEPKKSITRAEAIKMINNVMGQLIADDKVHSNITGTNLVVNTAGSTLSNISLAGNLYITVGAEEGTIVLDNVNVAGTIYINGSAKVIIRNSRVEQLIVNHADVSTTIELEGNTTIANLTLQTASQLVVAPQSSVVTLTVNAASSVTGTGTINKALINADNVSFSQSPKKITLTVKKVTIAGKVLTKEELEKDPSDNNTSTGPGTSTPSPKVTELFTYEQLLSVAKPTDSEALVQQYIRFLQDPSYTPSIANSATEVPDFTNALTFVNADFDVKPSIFASLRGINTSILNKDRTILWIGTDAGVTQIKLSDNAMKSYNVENKQLTDNRVLLIISDGNTGIFAITENGVSHIYQ
ncbi:MAG: S-layer homology domain-containing protein [Candidatus Pristimantibacillus lignocellulolyticus]|uniref:S-layer homology domain-containing protein n=1 Tax=Candidatus Pristimantibacillus lignocellulolyticus TaxID=2994561 RepID=A0A9J6ZKS7_9BACL|nr:MAG: S-layer homology domain-containing protein [Candidatus Pristimantibacillus lignocellulolyticus]